MLMCTWGIVLLWVITLSNLELTLRVFKLAKDIIERSALRSVVLELFFQFVNLLPQVIIFIQYDCLNGSLLFIGLGDFRLEFTFGSFMWYLIHQIRLVDHLHSVNFLFCSNIFLFIPLSNSIYFVHHLFNQQKYLSQLYIIFIHQYDIKTVL